MASPADIVQNALDEIRSFAVLRGRDVAQGLETRQFAAFVVQRYGYGVLKGVEVALGQGGRDAVRDATARIDEIVATIDPDWQETQARRWALRPTDLAFGTLQRA